MQKRRRTMKGERSNGTNKTKKKKKERRRAIDGGDGDGDEDAIYRIQSVGAASNEAVHFERRIKKVGAAQHEAIAIAVAGGVAAVEHVERSKFDARGVIGPNFVGERSIREQLVAAAI